MREDWPLYDILTLFRKGHSHMAIVLKSKEGARHTENFSNKPATTVTNTYLNLKQNQEVEKGNDTCLSYKKIEFWLKFNFYMKISYRNAEVMALFLQEYSVLP